MMMERDGGLGERLQQETSFAVRDAPRVLEFLMCLEEGAAIEQLDAARERGGRLVSFIHDDVTCIASSPIANGSKPSAILSKKQ